MHCSLEGCRRQKCCAPCSRRSADWRCALPLWLALALAVVTLAAGALRGHLLINFTASVPRGIYWISPAATIRRGDLVALAIPASVRNFLHQRKYVPQRIELLAKPVAGVPGDEVCVRDGTVRINGRVLAVVRVVDSQGLALPVHLMCGPVPHNAVFLATHHENSFDSRNFGPVSIDRLRGPLTPLVTF